MLVADAALMSAFDICDWKERWGAVVIALAGRLPSESFGVKHDAPMARRV